MRDLVGIVRREDEMKKALDKVMTLGPRESGRLRRPPRVQPGLAHGTRPRESNSPCRRHDHDVRAGSQREPGDHFRDDHPDKSKDYAKHNTFIRKGSSGEMVLSREPISEMPAELKEIVEEQQK
jgi:succinate dehydrogenase / fumarate reductase flavoprotein subunit